MEPIESAPIEVAAGAANELHKSLPEHQAKERLLAAASRLFLERGYAATSVNEIVEAAGVAKPTLYYYFKNKEAIYLAIIQQACEVFYSVISAHAEPKEGAVMDHIVELAGQIHDVFVKQIDAARLIHAKVYGPPLGAPPLDMTAVETSFMGIFKHIVQLGIDRGEFEGDVDEIVMTIGSIIDSSLSAEINTTCSTRPGREGMQRLLRVLHRGLAPQPASANRGEGLGV